jgi:predicted transcriptional regulator
MLLIKKKLTNITQNGEKTIVNIGTPIVEIIEEKRRKMTIQELAKQTNVTESRVYQLAKKLGRLPTVAEIESRKGKRGRPKKYK